MESVEWEFSVGIFVGILLATLTLDYVESSFPLDGGFLKTILGWFYNFPITLKFFFPALLRYGWQIKSQDM